MVHTVNLDIAQQLQDAGWKGSLLPDLGELIRELPEEFILYHRPDNEYWYAKIDYKNYAYSDTPEDAAALAWIELKKAKQESE